MARSKKKYPITYYTTISSQKRGKRFANRRLRKHNTNITTHLLKEQNFEKEYIFKNNLRQIIDFWDLGGDGKRWWNIKKFPKEKRYLLFMK